MDNCAGSAAEKIDEKYEDDLDCVDVSLWEPVTIKQATIDRTEEPPNLAALVYYLFASANL